MEEDKNNSSAVKRVGIAVFY